MSSTTSFLALVKQALDEHWSVDILNANLDKIDTAVSKTNRKIPYCSSLSALQTAIIDVVNTMNNQEVVLGYCDIGFSNTAIGLDGSKGSYIIERQTADVFNIHIFCGTSEAVAYYYSSAWHWATPTNYPVDVPITMDSTKVELRSWGKFAVRRTGGMLVIMSHGLVGKVAIANETVVATIPSVSGIPTASCAVKVDGQSEPGIAMFANNTLRLINIQNANYAMYFTLTVPLL